MFRPCSGFGVTGMFQLVKARLTVPTVLHTPDSLHYSGTAPVSEMQGQEETPRAPGMGTARVKGTMWGLRGFVGRKERKPAAAAWLVSTRPQALSGFSWPVLGTVNPSSGSVSSSTKWALPLESHWGSTSSATWDKRLGFSEARACSSALRSLRGLWQACLGGSLEHSTHGVL